MASNITTLVEKAKQGDADAFSTLYQMYYPKMKGKCSSASRSEIVVPVIRNGEVIAVLDIDSEHLNTFDSIYKEWLEKVSEVIDFQGHSL